MNKALDILKAAKSKDVTTDMLVNVWLEEFHNTSLEDIVAKGVILDSRTFYKEHEVSEEQHDWWVSICKPIFIKKFKLVGRHKDSSWSFAYLDTAPSVKQD